MALVSQFSDSFLSYKLHSVVRYGWMDRKTGTWKERFGLFLFSALGVQVSIGLREGVKTNHCYPRLSGLFWAGALG